MVVVGRTARAVDLSETGAATLVKVTTMALKPSL